MFLTSPRFADVHLPHKLTDVAGDKVFESVPPQPTILGVTQETFQRGLAGLSACLAAGLAAAFYYGNATAEFLENVSQGELNLPAPITTTKSEEGSADEMIPLSLITDEIFDGSDHIFVFVVGDPSWLADVELKKRMKQIMDKLGKHKPPLKFHYTVQESVKENTDQGRQLKFMVGVVLRSSAVVYSTLLGTRKSSSSLWGFVFVGRGGEDPRHEHEVLFDKCFTFFRHVPRPTAATESSISPGISNRTRSARFAGTCVNSTNSSPCPTIRSWRGRARKPSPQRNFNSLW